MMGKTDQAQSCMQLTLLLFHFIQEHPLALAWPWPQKHSKGIVASYCYIKKCLKQMQAARKSNVYKQINALRVMKSSKKRLPQESLAA